MLFRSVVKVHPSEKITDIQNYQSIINDRNAERWVSIHYEGDIYKYISLSDLVITLFSHVGLEAAVAGKPVFNLNLLGFNYPINPLNYGSILNINNENQLRNALFKFLHDEKFSADFIYMHNEFRNANPQLFEGNPVDRIINLALNASK